MMIAASLAFFEFLKTSFTVSDDFPQRLRDNRLRCSTLLIYMYIWEKINLKTMWIAEVCLLSTQLRMCQMTRTRNCEILRFPNCGWKSEIQLSRQLVCLRNDSVVVLEVSWHGEGIENYLGLIAHAGCGVAKILLSKATRESITWNTTPKN